MSLEWWSRFGGGALPLRTVRCGHRLDSEQVKAGDSGFNCPSCGIPQERLAPGELSSALDFVPSPELLWDSAERTQARVLQASDPEKAVSTLDSLLAHLSARGGDIHMQHRTLEARSPPRRLPPSALLVYRASPHGSVVASGEIRIPGQAVVLLDGHGLSFRQVSFQGGALVCAGPDFTAAFHDCTFTACQLHAVHGAAVTLRRCRMIDSLRGIVASGPGTAATLVDCVVQDCRTAFYAERGASLAAHDSSIVGSDVAASLDGEGTNSCLTSCAIGSKHAENLGFCGVLVQRGALCMLRDCQMRCFQTMASVADRGSRLELLRCYAASCIDGVVISAHACVMLREVVVKERPGRITQSTAGIGWVVAGLLALHAGRQEEGAGRAVIERCALPQAPSAAVLVLNSSAASMLLCSVQSAERGVQVGWDIDSNVSGQMCKLVAQHCQIEGEGSGCELHNAVALLRHCHTACSRPAILVEGRSVLSAVDTHIHATGPGCSDAMSAQPGATLRLLRCQISCARSCYCLRSGCSSRMVETCVCMPHPGGNVPGSSKGLAVLSSGSAQFVRCTFVLERCGTTAESELPEGDACLGLCHAAHVTCSDCTFDGWYVSGTGELDMGNVLGCEWAGDASWDAFSACVTGDKQFIIEHCTFTNSCVAVMLSSAACRVRGCTFGPHVAHGITSRRALLSVQQCTFVKCIDALLLNQLSVLHAEDCKCDVSGSAVYLSGAGKMLAKGVSVCASSQDALAIAVRSEPGQVTHALMRDCEVSGGSGAADFRGCGVHAEVQRCRLSAMDTAISVVHAALRVLDTCITDCQHAINVSGDDAGYGTTQVCKHCNATGEEGRMVAWAAAHGERCLSGGMPGCIHEGAAAKVELQGVEISDCFSGVVVGPWGHVAATRVKLSICSRGTGIRGTGICVIWIAERSTFVDCVVSVEAGAIPAICFRLLADGSEVDHAFPPGVDVKYLAGPPNRVRPGVKELGTQRQLFGALALLGALGRLKRV